MDEGTVVVEGRACHCGGAIIQTVTQKKVPWSGPAIYGPGGEGQIQEVKSYHCIECGLVYVPNKEGLVGLKKMALSRKSLIRDCEEPAQEIDE